LSKVPLTARGAAQLKEELQRLKFEERPKVTAAIATARAHGDLKENAEYHAAKEQQGMMEARIRDIESKLGNAQIIDVTAVNAGGKVVWINEGFTRLFGYTLEECRGKFGPGVLRGPKTGVRLLADVAQAARAGRPFHGELLSYSKDQREICTDFDMQPLRDEAGTVTGFMSIQLDVTARKAAENEARRLALVASRTASSIILADVNWQIEWVNDSFTRLTGYALDEVRGRRPSSFLAGPLTNRDVVDAMDEADRAGQPFKGELLNYTKTDQPYWVEIEIQRLTDDQGRHTGYMALQLDITERKQAEQELAQREAQFRFILNALPDAGDARYAWSVSAPGLDLVEDATGDFRFVDPGRLTRFVIPAPVMWDSAAGGAPVAVATDWEQHGETWTMTMAGWS